MPIRHDRHTRSAFPFRPRASNLGAVFGSPSDPTDTGAQRVAALQLRSAAGRLTADVTWPAAAQLGPAPALVVYFADAGARDAVPRVLSCEAGVVVLAVRCRARRDAFTDAATALEWAADHAAELDADGRRLLGAGHGTGARLAAALALHARDERWPRLLRQVLVYPRLGVPESRSRPALDGGDGSPLRADVAGVAPAIVLTSRGPALRDDGGRYATRLRQAGVDVEELHGDGAAGAGLGDLARALRRQLATGRVDSTGARLSSQ